jgi:hypothetical protein
MGVAHPAMPFPPIMQSGNRYDAAPTLRVERCVSFFFLCIFLEAWYADLSLAAAAKAAVEQTGMARRLNAKVH